MSNEVSFIYKRTIVGTKPVQPGKHFPLSVLDRLMEHHHIKAIYYYKSPAAGAAAGEATRRLQMALADALCCFPVVTGRLVAVEDGGGWVVKCNDAGVRIVAAKAKGSVEEWLKNVSDEKESQLLHWEDMYYKPYYWSTFYLKVTEFKEGGMAVGLSCSHLLSDPICAAQFIRAWSDTTLASQKFLSPPFFHPLPTRRSPNHRSNAHLVHHYKSIIQSPNWMNARKCRTIALEFTDPMVQACMEKARIDPHGLSVSPFSALIGLLWSCISRVKGNENELTGMSICLDMRRVLGLDKGYFGNCMVYNKVHGVGLDVGDIPRVARAVDEAIRRMDSEGVMDLIEWLEEQDGPTTQGPPPSVDGQDLICVNLEGSDLDSTMFEGCNRPIRVSYYVEPIFGLGRVLVLPSSPEKGPLSRVVRVTLLEDEVVELLENDLLLEFSPVILMGLN